jgi:hypothetical protein
MEQRTRFFVKNAIVGIRHRTLYSFDLNENQRIHINPAFYIVCLENRFVKKI